MPESGTSKSVASMKWTSTFVVGALIVLCVITPSAETTVLCGDRLTKMVEEVCRGRNQVLCGAHVADPLVKRDSSAGLFWRHGGRYLVQTEDGEAGETRRMKRGIADECCTEGRCKYDYLKTFCCAEQ